MWRHRRPPAAAAGRPHLADTPPGSGAFPRRTILIARGRAGIPVAAGRRAGTADSWLRAPAKRAPCGTSAASGKPADVARPASPTRQGIRHNIPKRARTHPGMRIRLDSPPCKISRGFGRHAQIMRARVSAVYAFFCGRPTRTFYHIRRQKGMRPQKTVKYKHRQSYPAQNGARQTGAAAL